jgi:Fe-S cluster biogenesis protein NfuA
MTNPLDAKAFQAELQRLDALVRGVERFADPQARETAREVVRAVLELHGRGLERILGLLGEPHDAGRAVLEACSHDEVVSGLLLLHGLHPLGLRERVLRALDDVRPALRSHGGDVELLGVEEGVVRLRLRGSCHGCPSSAATMKQTIEEAILGRAPDALGVEVEGVVEGAPAVAAGGRTALPVLSGA